MSSQKQLNFYHGLLCLPKGLKEIFSDIRVFLYTLIPILIGGIFVYFSFYYGWDWSGDLLKKYLSVWLNQWISEKNYFYKMIFSAVNFIAKILFTLIVIYLGFIFVQIISIPFYSLICERVLVRRKVFPIRSFSIGIWISLTVRLFVISVFRMMIFLAIGLLVFLISLIPGLQGLALIYSGLAMAMDSIDYTLEIYDIGLARRFSIYFSNMGFFMGVAVVLLPTLFIPGLTLLLLPITVVGSSVCFADIKGKSEYEKLIA